MHNAQLERFNLLKPYAKNIIWVRKVDIIRDNGIINK